jgi:hypothetical protein
MWGVSGMMGAWISWEKRTVHCKIRIFPEATGYLYGVMSRSQRVWLDAQGPEEHSLLVGFLTVD